MRLDKFLCEMNIGSRSQVKTYIKQGFITVNGCVTSDHAFKVNELQDEITFHGKKITYEKFHYYMLYKPSNVVSATKDNLFQTVIELLPPELRHHIFPVGRLDKDTEGLLLLTDHGELAHKLLSPSKHVDKCYLVTTRTPLSETDCNLLEQGVDIGEKHLTKPSKVKKCESSEYQIYLTIHEGKFHQVKRMLKAVGNEVVHLKRIQFGSLSLDPTLQPGQYRCLTETEIQSIIKDK